VSAALERYLRVADAAPAQGLTGRALLEALLDAHADYIRYSDPHGGEHDSGIVDVACWRMEEVEAEVLRRMGPREGETVGP